MSGLNDILKNNNGKLPEDMLLAYLEGRLAPEEQHHVEEWMGQDGMEADALEGLQNIPAKDTVLAVDKLNYRLRKDLSNRRNKHKALKGSYWSWLAIAIVLLICIAAYIVIFMVLKK